MASKFEIFDDQENFEEKKFPKYGELKRDKSKLMPLASKDGNENVSDQVGENFSFIFAAKLALLEKNSVYIRNTHFYRSRRLESPQMQLPLVRLRTRTFWLHTMRES